MANSQGKIYKPTQDFIPPADWDNKPVEMLIYGTERWDLITHPDWIKGNTYRYDPRPILIPYMTEASHQICDLLRLDGFTEDQSLDFIKMLTALEKRKFNLYKEN